MDESFDCIFTTIDLQTKTNIPIIKINSMIDDEEIERGKNQMLAVNLRAFLAKYLRPELLLTGIYFHSQKEAVHCMCSACRKFYELPEKFEEAVLSREEISSTEFASLLAVPHPIYPMTEKSFLAVAVPSKPFLWHEQQISLIILFSCSKTTDDKMDRLFEIIGGFTGNKETVRSFIENPSYENLLYLIEKEVI